MRLQFFNGGPVKWARGRLALVHGVGDHMTTISLKDGAVTAGTVTAAARVLESAKGGGGGTRRRR